METIFCFNCDGYEEDVELNDDGWGNPCIDDEYAIDILICPNCGEIREVTAEGFIKLY